MSNEELTKRIEKLEALPKQLVIAIGTAFGSTLLTVGYSLIADHIAIQAINKEIVVIDDKMNNGQSRLYTPFIQLKGEVELNTDRSKANAKWIESWQSSGELPLDKIQNMRLDNLEKGK